MKVKGKVTQTVVRTPTANRLIKSLTRNLVKNRCPSDRNTQFAAVIAYQQALADMFECRGPGRDGGHEYVDVVYITRLNAVVQSVGEGLVKERHVLIEGAANERLPEKWARLCERGDRPVRRRST